jgi:hypothetical protein
VCDDGNNDNTDTCTTACKGPVCGDGFTQPGHNGETCDDGNAITEVCPYNTSCMVCDSNCHLVAGAVPTCGDGVLQGNSERCDNKNGSCGTCQSSCNLIVAASAADGLLFSGPATDFHDGDTLAISDGVPGKAAVTFTFHSPTAGGPAIQISGDSFTMAGKIQDAINSSGLRITAIRQGNTGIISLVNHQPSASGNTGAIAVTGNINSTTNANTTFFFQNFSGGAAGDCTLNARCASSADCLTNLCDPASNTCKKCTANADCASSNCEVVSGQCQVCTEDRDCIGPNRACTVATGVCHAASSIAGE